MDDAYEYETPDDVDEVDEENGEGGGLLAQLRGIGARVGLLDPIARVRAGLGRGARVAETRGEGTASATSTTRGEGAASVASAAATTRGEDTAREESTLSAASTDSAEPGRAPPVPDLGDDNFSVLSRRPPPRMVNCRGDDVTALNRARVTEMLFAKVDEPPKPAEPAKTKGTSMRPGQVDLNDEKNLQDLEDPALVKHMREARAALAKHQAGLAQLPTIEELTRKDVAARRGQSTVVTSVKDLLMNVRCACDDVILQQTNVGQLKNGERPHGFPGAEVDRLDPESDLGKNMAHLEKKLKLAGEALTEIVAALEACERELTLSRRGYEAVVDGLRSRHDNLELTARAAETALATGGKGAPAPKGK